MGILKKGAAAIVAALFLYAGIGAGNGVCEDNEAKVIVKQGDSTAVSVNNFLCPVSEDDIDKATAIKVEYKGKIYNLCCSACAKHFIKHPEKFAQLSTSPR